MPDYRGVLDYRGVRLELGFTVVLILTMAYTCKLLAMTVIGSRHTAINCLSTLPLYNVM